MFALARNISIKPQLSNVIRSFSATAVNLRDRSCKLLIIGGGSGGCTIASKFARRLGRNNVIVLEPCETHYYQPLFTLVGAGVTRVANCAKPEGCVLPEDALWLRDAATRVDPDSRAVITACGDVISYEYVVIAVGLQYNYSKVLNLKEALDDPKSGVSTIYSPAYCEKTWSDLKAFKGGEAIFTYPDTPIKCPGAPQKIAYLADSYFRKTKLRSKSKIAYNTSLPVIFGVKKYADALQKVVKRKDIEVNYRTVLKEVRPARKEAVFFNADCPEKEVTWKYDLLHVTPPMKTPEFLSSNRHLADAAGFLDVDMYSLQHKRYPNVYGIGDCTNTPNSKTAAAIAKQSYVLEANLLCTMAAKEPRECYDGYGACPLVTSYNTCIMAEFVYNGVPRETLPINQAEERIISYYMKRYLFPFIYWNFMLKGKYHGPEFVRRIINPFAK